MNRRNFLAAIVAAVVAFLFGRDYIDDGGDTVPPVTGGDRKAENWLFVGPDETKVLLPDAPNEYAGVTIAKGGTLKLESEANLTFTK